ncbi:MAG: hypothetical protein IJX59_02450, partial [Clostridia bacterium]|nr:hypothetical protein [Clostridia bacterium]
GFVMKIFSNCGMPWNLQNGSFSMEKRYDLQTRIDISNDDVICTECQNDILIHLKDHHSN